MGMSMIGTMVAIVIVLGATAFFITGGLGFMEGPEERADGKGKTLIGGARYTAEDTVCQTQLGQVRQWILISMGPVNNTYPVSLSSVGSLPRGYDTCPIDDEQYDYVPSTGSVSCPHLGHENY